MMIKSIGAIIVFMLILGLSTMFGNASNAYVFNTDSIPSATKKIEYLIDVSQKFQKLNSSLCIDAITQAHKLSLNENNPDLQAKCNWLKGVYLYNQQQYDDALVLLKKALTYYESAGDDSLAAQILVDIGNVYYQNSKFSKSIIYYNSALASFVKSGDSLNIVLSYTKLGISNAGLKNNSVAVDYFNNALSVSDRNSYNYFIADNYLNLSDANMLTSETDTAFAQILIALNIASQNNYTNIVSDAYFALSEYYSAVKNPEKAKAEIAYYIAYNDSLNSIDNVKLEYLLKNISSTHSSVGNGIGVKVGYWIVIVLLIILVLFVLLKLMKQKNLNTKQAIVVNQELNAHKSINYDYADVVNKKTESKKNELKNQIADSKNAEIALNNSLKNLHHVNSLKDIFLSKISHEIRTPLNGIVGFSEMLETDLALLDYPDLFEYANSISQSGQSLVVLLNNILDISKLDSNNMVVEFKELKINEIIQNVVDSFFKEFDLKGVKLVFSPISIPNVYTDGSLLSKVVSIILSNAVKFTEKGFVNINTSFDEKSNTVILSIKDTGIGIDKVYIDKVFEPFRQESLGYTKSYQGAGLGLPLAKKILTKLNGGIKIESEKGVGTTIIITVPVYDSALASSAKNAETKVVEKTKPIILPWESLSVLVVEDDQMNQILYRKLLKKAKNLQIAKDGKVALSIIENPSSGSDFDLVLMDINLPVPWTGISLMHEIRKKYPSYKKIPFIAQTAYAISGNREAMLNEGFNEYITKPILKTALVNAINKVVV